MNELVTQSLENIEPKVDGASFQPADGPLFVVGMWRSGTSLLYALLNQHPQISLMYEEDLAHVRSLFWIPRDTQQWLAKWDFWNDALTRHKIDMGEIPSGIHDLKTGAEAVYKHYAKQKKGATIWGSKSPTYHDSISRLSKTFPNARFVIIWRDLRSTCRSIIEASPGNLFFSRPGMLLRAILGYREIKKQCDSMVERGVPLHQIYYEDLVRDPNATMIELCEFLQIPFDPKMVCLEGADRSAIQEGPHHSLVKSQEIVASRNTPAGLPPEIKSKIDRYLHLWREQFQGTWPLYPESLEEVSANPSAWERLRDRIAYKVLSTYHHTIPVVFSFVPFFIWRKYRKISDAHRYRRSFRGTNGNSS